MQAGGLQQVADFPVGVVVALGHPGAGNARLGQGRLLAWSSDGNGEREATGRSVVFHDRCPTMEEERGWQWSVA